MAGLFSIDARAFKFAAKPIIVKTLTESHREYLNRSGGLVRKYAQRSMRKGRISKRSGTRLRSKPNQPPRYFSGELRKLIFYRITPDNRAVYIEPRRFPTSKVADVLETGGRTTISDWVPGQGPQVRSVTIQPRPYMNPARDKIEPTLSRIWEDSFRKKRAGRF